MPSLFPRGNVSKTRVLQNSSQCPSLGKLTSRFPKEKSSSVSRSTSASPCLTLSGLLRIHFSNPHSGNAIAWSVTGSSTPSWLFPVPLVSPVHLPAQSLVYHPCCYLSTTNQRRTPPPPPNEPGDRGHHREHGRPWTTYKKPGTQILNSWHPK